MNFRTITSVVLATAVIGWGFFFTTEHFAERADEGMTFDRPSAEPPIAQETRSIAEMPEPPIVTPAKESAVPKIWPDISFISQAPTGEWGKSEFQNGCEEASVLMAHAWRTGKTYTKDTAKQELVAMARYQEKEIGQGIDTNARDTAEVLLKGYFGITDYRIVYDFSLSDLRLATAEGLVIVPTNGRLLGNPNFTAPGPLQHMLVVTGYDELKKEFVTNDPGTRKGEDYHYPEETLFDAIREYPTGKHLPITAGRKAMVVVPPAAHP